MNIFVVKCWIETQKYIKQKLLNQYFNSISSRFREAHSSIFTNLAV